MELDTVEMDVWKRPRASTEEAGRRWEPARVGGGAGCGAPPGPCPSHSHPLGMSWDSKKRDALADETPISKRPCSG